MIGEKNEDQKADVLQEGNGGNHPEIYYQRQGE